MAGQIKGNAPIVEPSLEAKTLSKSYGAVSALKNVDIQLYPGEVLGLVGDNGAGKTTLVKCLSGVHQPDSGNINIKGVKREGLTADIARGLGVETVYQNLSLVDTLDVMQNFFLNREIFYGNPLARKFGLLNRKRMYQETSKNLTDLKLNIDARRPVAALSGGQRQMIAVARAIAWGKHIVMLDEPAAALGVKQAKKVLEFIRSMANLGAAVLLISHNMQHVLQITDRVVVLRHGEKVGDFPTKGSSAQKIVSLITGSDLEIS